MGCVPSKQNIKVGSPNFKKVAPSDFESTNTKNASIKINILDAIKRGDAILFEKTMHTYQIRPTEAIGPQEEKKTILHYIAEFNFAEGMALALDYIIHNNPTTASQDLNIKDSNGNTPAILCCIFDAVETLDILLKSGYVNMNAKNMMGQTAQMIAGDNESPCIHALSATNTRDTTRSIVASSQQSQDSKSPKMPPSNKEDAVINNAPKGLRSIHSLKKEAKLGTDTKLYQLLMDLTIKNINFVDEEFPHDGESVVGDDFRSKYMDDYGVIKWCRPSEIFDSDVKSISLFEGIDLNDLSQSPLAGCDLYSVLAVMTEFPQRLLKTFTTKETNKQGAYSVKFHVSGTPMEILLDDYFPCVQSFKAIQPLFSRPTTNELWFMLAEKAFAKLYGSYDDVKQVQVNDAFEILTGMPCAQYTLKDRNKDDLWNQMLDYDKKNYIVCAGNPKTDDEKNNRIFSVVRTYETELYKIIKLRNHFGDFNWKGDFSDGSELWTKELKEEVGHYTGEKNCFYMEISEFMKQFEFLTVCYYQENWIKNGEDVITNAKQAAFFEVEVDREMEAIFAVHQKLPRFVDDPDYDISPVEILVAEELKEENSLKRVAKGETDAFIGKPTVYADNKIKTKLSEGRYIIRVKIRWVDNGQHDFILNTFSTYPLSFKKVKARDHADFLERVYLDSGNRSNDRYQLGNKCEFASSWCGPHLWLYGINKGTKTWNLEINFNKLENLKLCKKYRTSDNILTLVIPPKGQAVAFAKRINTKTVELNWNFNQSWV